jgi:parallel beta-helix repeat protein
MLLIGLALFWPFPGPHQRAQLAQEQPTATLGQLSPIPVTSCQYLSSAGSTYVLTNSIVSSADVNNGFGEAACVVISGPNVIFDLNGFNITDTRSSGDECCAVAVESVNDTVNGPGTLQDVYTGIRIAPHPSYVPSTSCSQLSNGGASCNQNATVQHVTFRGGAGVSFSDSICGLLFCNPYISNDNHVLNNQISFCSDGIQINGSGNIIAGNIISQNRGPGINMYYSNGNTIYNNFLNNAQNVANALGSNYWNTTKRTGPNIVGGPFIGGNFWSDYNGTDPDSDGFGDTFLPYNSNGNIGSMGDQLPLFSEGFALGLSPESVGPLPTGTSGFSTITISSVQTFSGTVSLSAVPSTGLSVSIDATSLGLTPGGSNGTRLTLSAVTPGAYTVTVTGASGGFTHSITISVMVIAARHPTSISVSCAPSTVPTGAPTTCTATVIDTSTSPTTPTGFVGYTLVTGSGTFNSTLCTLSGSGFSSSCQVTYTSREAPDSGVFDTVSAVYGGDPAHSISTHSTFPISIVQRVTTSSLSCLPSSVKVTQSSVCTVTVTDVSPGTTPDPLAGHGVAFYTNGLGTFSSSYSVQNQCVLAGTDPIASCSVNYTPSDVGSGTHMISTGYSDHTHAPSFSNFNLTVTPAALHVTTTSVSCDTPVVVNQPSLCTATVTDTSITGATSPSGTVGFTDHSLTGSFAPNPCTLVAGTTGIATCSVNVSFGQGVTTPFPTDVSASYGGDLTHMGSSSTFTVTVNPRTTSTTITCDSPVVLPGSSICTVTVTDTDVGTPITPGSGGWSLITNSTGSFSAGQFTNLCFLSSGAPATCTVTYTPTVVGGHKITANYPGDAYHLPSSGFFDIAASGKVTPTLSSTITPSSITIGGSASDLATLTGGSTPTGTVTYTAYSDASCTTLVFTSANIALGSPSAAFTPSTAGTYFFIATYNGDANNNVAATSCGATGETLTVTKVTPTVTTAVSPATITIGGSATDLATLSGGFSPSGTVTYTAYTLPPGGANFCTNLVFTSANVPLGTSSAAFTPTVAGGYNWIASYSGDANNNAVATACLDSGETLIVNKVTPTVTTSVSPASITIGGSANDLATVSGGFSPTGTVTYTAYSDAACTTQVFMSSNVPLGSPSAAFTPSSAGSYFFIAAYSGDGNNNPVTIPCAAANESLTVQAVTPALTTTVSSTGIPLGGSVTDQATLTGGYPATGVTGTVTYDFYILTITGGNCYPASLVSSQTVPVGSGNSVPPTSPITPASTGTYSFQASYSGDPNNNPVTSACEVLTVTQKATPTVTTTVTPPSITIGGSATDLATVSGGSSPTGTVTYTAYSDSACTTLVFTSAGVPLGTSSAAFTPTATGTYLWIASYSGDGNNNPVTTTCGATNEVLTVTKATPTITSTVTPNSVTVGGSASDLATLTGGFSPTGSVSYTIYSDSACTVVKATTINFLGSSSGPIILSPAGAYMWVASYNGDANNNAVATTCGATGETLTVNKVTPTIITSLSATQITVGGSVFDTATMNGGFQAGGSLGYNLFTNANCREPGSTLVSLVTVTSGVIPNSDSHTLSLAGSYSWNVSYSGDVNNNPATSACEPLTANVASPTIATTLSANPVTVGGSVSDSAALTSSFQAGGTVTYNFFTGSTCTGTATVVGSPVTVTGGVVPNSASQSFNTAGSFSWNAVYSGDANNNGNTSPCEPLTVNPATGVGITTTLSANTITVGGSVTDSAKLTGVTATAGGTVTYNIFTTGGCTGTSAIVSTATVTNGIVPNSASKTFTTAGADSWNAVYSGDTNNSGATSGCEPLTVNSPTTKPVLLSFQGFNLDDFDNGVGQLQIQVNGVNVTDIPHFPGTGDYASYTNKWISFSIDITSFVHLGQNTIVFLSPPPGHDGLIRNVTIIQGNTILLHVQGARSVSLDRSVKFTFSNPTLVITSFTISTTTPSKDQKVTFTATYTGGTAPFTCVFRFGDGESRSVPGNNGSCSVTHDYDYTGMFTATVLIVGASTSDRVSAKLTLTA